MVAVITSCASRGHTMDTGNLTTPVPLWNYHKHVLYRGRASVTRQRTHEAGFSVIQLASKRNVLCLCLYKRSMYKKIQLHLWVCAWYMLGHKFLLWSKPQCPLTFYLLFLTLPAKVHFMSLKKCNPYNTLGVKYDVSRLSFIKDALETISYPG